jgi:DNA-binding transcriptional LysR family regulator
MDEFSLTGLRTVREVARHGSFSAAAEVLGYTQSAVSRQVALAERAAGRALFARHARGVALTPAGEVVVRHAIAALAELQAARNVLDDLGTRGLHRVRLGGFSTAMAAIVPAALARLGRDAPQVSVVLREGTSDRLIQQVASGRLELAVVTASGVPAPHAEGVTLTHLLEDPLLVAFARDHRLAGLPRVTPGELRDEPWIAGSSDPSSTLLGAWRDGSWKPRIAHEVRDWTAKVGLVAGGLGITVVPGIAVAMLPPGVSVAAIDHPAATRTLALAGREADAASANVAAVSDALRASASAHRYRG